MDTYSNTSIDSIDRSYYIQDIDDDRIVDASFDSMPDVDEDDDMGYHSPWIIRQIKKFKLGGPDLIKLQKLIQEFCLDQKLDAVLERNPGLKDELSQKLRCNNEVMSLKDISLKALAFMVRLVYPRDSIFGPLKNIQRQWLWDNQEQLAGVLILIGRLSASYKCKKILGYVRRAMRVMEGYIKQVKTL